MGEKPQKNIQPKFFGLLNKEDQDNYKKLRLTLSSHLCRNRRGKRIETFREMLLAIQGYCIHRNEDDWKRCLVCGICWIQNSVAINTRQLGLLIDKCKSSINGSLQKMGYNTLQSREESSTYLVEAIPFLVNNYMELREWTVRLFAAATPQPGLPQYHVNTIYNFASPTPNRSNYNYNFPGYQQPLPKKGNFVTPQLIPNKTENNDYDCINNSIDSEAKRDEMISSPNDENTLNEINDDNIDETRDDYMDPFCLMPSFLIDQEVHVNNNSDGNNDLFEESCFFD